MRLLLINKNPVVSRMIQMSVPKADFEVEECDSVYNLPDGEYEVVIIDDEMYDENFLKAIKQHIKYHKIGIVSALKDRVFEGFDFVLPKPFLPTDLIELLRRLKEEIISKKEESVFNEDIFQESNIQDSIDVIEDVGSKKDGFLEELEGFNRGNEDSEMIVEIEEKSEESPFVTDDLQKGGVLKEEEVQEVSLLLDSEEDSKEEIGGLEPASLNEEDLKRRLRNKSSELAYVVDENLEETQKAIEQESLALVEKEEVVVADEKSYEEVAIEEKKEEAKEKIEEKKIEEDIKPKEEIEKLKNNLENLSVKHIREILDGMQIDISIKITYGNKEDV